MVYELSDRFGRFGNEILILLKLMARARAEGAGMLRVEIRHQDMFTWAVRPMRLGLRGSDEEVASADAVVEMPRRRTTAKAVFYWPDDILDAGLQGLLRAQLPSLMRRPPKPPHSDSAPPSGECLTVHSRAGDTIGRDGGRPIHRNYVIYPVALVVYLLRRFGYARLDIVAEDPTFIWVERVRQEAAAMGVGVRVLNSEYALDDWMVVASATDVLLDFSTFTLTALFLSAAARRVFCVPALMPFPAAALPHAETIALRIDGYIPMRQWRYDEVQARMILEHPIEAVTRLPTNPSIRRGNFWII